MNKVTKFFMAALLAGMCSFGYAQTYEWQKPMQPTETYKATITKNYSGGVASYYKNGRLKDGSILQTYTIEYLYAVLEKEAKKNYGDNIVLRQFKSIQNDKVNCDSYEDYDICSRTYDLSAIVVIPNSVSTPTTAHEQPKPKADPLTQALSKALQNIREGSRLALDQIKVVGSTDKEDFKDQIIEILLDEGYKVVAKEYLEKLYQEQQDQQSGIYNDRTTVQDNNFSAVGYYVNVKQTETSIKVQVINVSTGEYEANTTINR